MSKARKFGPWLIAYRDRSGEMHATIEQGIQLKGEAVEIAAEWNANPRGRRPKYLEYEPVRLPAEVVARVVELRRRADALHDVEWAMRREANALISATVAELGEPF